MCSVSNFFASQVKLITHSSPFFSSHSSTIMLLSKMFSESPNPSSLQYNVGGEEEH